MRITNSRYDSILKSDDDALNKLFYKHHSNVLINNIGPYGSPYYFPTTKLLFSKRIIDEKDPILVKLYELNGVKPFTNITYLNASRKEQIFKIKHIQKFGKLLSFNFDLNKVSAPGAYLNQEANNGMFDARLKYHTKKNTYSIEFNNSIIRNFYDENGGIESIEDFENERYDDVRNYSVNLLNTNSFAKTYKYSLEQQLDLFRLNTDSIKPKKVFFRHNIDYTTSQRVFYDNDPNSVIYNTILIDSTSSIDSIYNNKLSNEFSLGLRDERLSLEFLGQYDYQNYFQSYGIDTNIVDVYTGAYFNYKIRNSEVQAVIKYGVNGYRVGDINSEITFDRKHKTYHLTINGGYYLNEADMKFLNYTSNHFEWTNYNLKKQAIGCAGIKFNWIKYGLEAEINTKIIENALYYDSLAIAAQNDEAISLTSLSLSRDYSLWNFHFKTAFIYQMTSDKVVAPMPEIVGRQIMYYEKMIFKKAMKMQLGFGFSYSTNYFGYAYMPALTEFYVQQHTDLGYYPQIDLFLNTHLKRAQIFLKYEHINAGRSLQKSYLAPGYPLLGKSMKFGISWNMFD